MSFRTTRIADKKYAKAIEKAFQGLFHLLPKIRDPSQLTRALEALAGTDRFLALADTAATRMIKAQLVENARDWREAALKGSNGRAVYKALQAELQHGMGAVVSELVEANARLIKSLPQDVAKTVTKRINEWTHEGKRPEEIAKLLQRDIPHLTKSHIKMIARTEVSKSQSALTRARSQDMGLDCYIWRTAGDGERVRDSHQNMDGVLVFWDDPPSPEALIGEKTYGKYDPGGIFNCRCYAEPVIDKRSLPERMRVYRNGRIQWMTRSQILKVA